MFNVSSLVIIFGGMFLLYYWELSPWPSVARKPWSRRAFFSGVFVQVHWKCCAEGDFFGRQRAHLRFDPERRIVLVTFTPKPGWSMIFHRSSMLGILLSLRRLVFIQFGPIDQVPHSPLLSLDAGPSFHLGRGGIFETCDPLQHEACSLVFYAVEWTKLQTSKNVMVHDCFEQKWYFSNSCVILVK